MGVKVEGAALGGPARANDHGPARVENDVLIAEAARQAGVSRHVRIDRSHRSFREAPDHVSRVGAPPDRLTHLCNRSRTSSVMDCAPIVIVGSGTGAKRGEWLPGNDVPAFAAAETWPGSSAPTM